MTSHVPPSPRGGLSEAAIVDVALALADCEGVEAISMRKLARHFGVTAMSLYNHVANKDALLDAMLGRIVTEITSPSDQLSWREGMRLRAQSLRAVLLRHRWAAPMLISRIVLTDAVMRDAEASLARLIEAGFTYGQADWARNAVDSHVYGYVMQELNYPVGPESYRAAAAQYLPMIDRAQYPHTYESAKAIIDERYDGLTSFEFGLDLVLDGVERWVFGGDAPR